MKFRDQLSALIADDKKDEAAKVFDALDKTLSEFAADVQDLKTKLRDKEGLKPEDFAALEKERDELKAALKEAEGSVKTLTSERDAAVQRATDSDTALGSHLIDGGLSSALNGKLKEPVFLNALKASLSKNFIVEKGQDGKPVAVAVIEKDGKKEKVTMDAYLEHWGATDEGKAYLLDSGGAGGGAKGSGGTGGTVTNKKWSEMSLKDRTELYQKDKAEYDRLSAENQ